MHRLRAEQVFHDQQATLRASTFDQHPELLHVDDDTYLDHESWVRPAFEALGDVRGLDVLDLGCGNAMASVVLARRGASVIAMDLSAAYLAEARRRAHANQVHIELLQADGARLPFRGASFDRIWGHAVLHHLDVGIAACELRRVLRPGGIAVFCEPWGGNTLLNLARRWLPYPGKHRTRDEEPLRSRQLREIARVFPQMRVRGFQLLTMLRRAVRANSFIQLLEKADARLLRRASLQRYCRYVVIEASGS